MSIGALAFLSPWLLAGLLSLPIIYWLLRTVPPRPRQVAFPATRILVGLENKEKTPAKTKAKPEAKPETAKVAPEPGVSYMLQAASFATFSEADQLKARLTISGLAAQIQKVSIEGRGDYYRVRLGPFSKIEELDSATQQLQQAGLKPIRLKVKKEGV